MARRNVTLAQIARRTGVHVSTVSRALNERTRHLVAENVAARIVATADALGYRPNVMAAALRTRRSRAVGIVVDTIADPAQLATLAGIEAALHEAGYVMTLTATGGDPQRLAATLDTLAGRGSDGAILLD
ncbi:MAG: LacI family DNA-binding transcriptional regulator, partial [Alphaproteobacteria bacterium]